MIDIAKYNAESMYLLSESYPDRMNNKIFRDILDEIRFGAENGEFERHIDSPFLTLAQKYQLEALGYEVDTNDNVIHVSWKKVKERKQNESK